MIVATLGSSLSDAEIQKLFGAVFKARPEQDDVIQYVYVALAAGVNVQALTVAEKLEKGSADPKRMALLAECRAATGDREGALKEMDAALVAAKGSPLEPKLKLDRSRISAGTGEAAEVIGARLAASEFWRRLDTDDRVGFVPPSTIGGGGFPAAVALRKLSYTIGAKCAMEANGADRAYGNIDVDNTTGKVTGISLFMQDTTNKKLRECIETELRNAQLPLTPTRVYQLTAVFVFHSP
jgi:hypothetical protein